MFPETRDMCLVIGTFGICIGVWVTLGYLVYLNGLGG